MDDLMRYWPVVAFLTGLVLAAAGWAIRKGLASREELQKESEARALAIAEVEQRIVKKLEPLFDAHHELADRTLRIETEIRHLPSADDIADLKQQLGRADARLESLGRETQSITNALTRVENHLLKGVAS